MSAQPGGSLLLKGDRVFARDLIFGQPHTRCFLYSCIVFWGSKSKLPEGGYTNANAHTHLTPHHHFKGSGSGVKKIDGSRKEINGVLKVIIGLPSKITTFHENHGIP